MAARTSCSPCTTRSHISYTAHALYARAFFVFLNCTKESPAHAIVPMRTSPPVPAPATYAFVPALTITHALAPRAMLLYNVCESLAHEAPIRHNGCKFDSVSAVPWEDV